MKFGFDIDDTLINLREHAFLIYREKLNMQLPMESFYSLQRVEIHEPFGLTDEEGKKLWENTLETIYYTDCPIFPGALKTIQDLKYSGHDIYYITARPHKHGERTKVWLREQGFPIEDDKFYYGMKDNEKINIIHQLNLDYYVDDKPTVLRTLKNMDTTPIIKDQSYNKEYREATRLFHWSEFKHMYEKSLKHNRKR
ncbi:5' nucleotidase, NT5C type [Virgibacillus salexigens]|uniref:Nucleotidase n=1 Tax=Virgibacillus kapii TaxID=1638645 RepID=A0ABQ2DV31_9BACI|nr:hypothetical protein [Virgibacillus kapii]GGJ71254.1 putative nucleotidase [Virgibacillus kapii]